MDILTKWTYQALKPKFQLLDDFWPDCVALKLSVLLIILWLVLLSLYKYHQIQNYF